MEAMKVFSESLRYLKDHALNMIRKHICGRTFSASDVSWVLTVPAIWNPAAKQFMREAAIQVSLPKLFSTNVMVLCTFEIPFEYQFMQLLTITAPTLTLTTNYFYTTRQTTALPLLEV